MMPRSLWHNHNLFTYICSDLRSIELTAVAVCPRSHKKKPKSHAWVCFSDLVNRDRFVEEWNGRQVDDKILQVTAILPPDGAIPKPTFGVS